MGEKLAVSVSLACENQPEVIIPLHGEGRSKIEKVPAILRDVKANSDCFDPLVVSIGPYHHGKAQLARMQQHKKTMACQYADKYLTTSLEDLYQKFSPLAIDARDCYTEEEVDKFNDKEFIEMMVIDTCFILHFIDCFREDKLEDLKMKNNKIAFVQRDLLLLENQIPFKVLNEISRKELVKISPEETTQTTIQNFLSGFPYCVKREPAHLLDLMRSNLVGECAWKKNAQRGECGRKKNAQRGVCGWKKNAQRKRKGSHWFSYRSAQELKAKGIHFRPSKTNKFTDVCFRSLCFCAGYLSLPQIGIDDSTKSMLLNMVAHESSTDGPDDLGVSSYICFMDSLVDHAEDVKELRKKGILLNYLGSDQQVADLFNEISDNLVPHRDAYVEVKEMLEKHYTSKWKTWLAEVLYTHFSSPWTIIAFFAAILALGMSFLQTYKDMKHST
ncbi:putative UPF0481 protein At3g02645 [Mangifera indica]|uniref:putative UPF0481 protein At3g02645 n=1 Tax=Mangifera indica TaxID=29780 RepID=UPI001CFA39B4|nr:putative UPF0481 protein At3g02645 [Mangifera indica]